MNLFGIGDSWSFGLGGVFLSVLFFAAGGCGESQSSRNPGVPVHPVKATVTYNSEPVENALVSLQSADQSQSAFGKTNADGVADLTTFDHADGAVPGEHQVKITKDEVVVVRAADPNNPATGEVTKINRLLPVKYSKFTTSGLTLTVTEGQNEFTFELKD